MTCCPVCGAKFETPAARARPAMGLTRQQGRVLKFIVAYQAAHNGVSPSFDEMARELDFSSKGGVHRIVCQLEDRGHLVRLKRQSRALMVVREAAE